MSFVPAVQQANNAAAKPSLNAAAATSLTTAAAAAAAAADATEIDDKEVIFRIRTFDVFWVEKHALMNKDGYAKVRTQGRRGSIANMINEPFCRPRNLNIQV
jgi:hypothetical protein